MFHQTILDEKDDDDSYFDIIFPTFKKQNPD